MFFRDPFGLFHVDFSTADSKRTENKSAEVSSQLTKSNKIAVELLSDEVSK
jgi:beta-glucosidase/6-phospho-beta-glucosidase/beta-galactosidase